MFTAHSDPAQAKARRIFRAAMMKAGARGKISRNLLRVGGRKGNFARTPLLQVGQDVISVVGEDFDRDGKQDIAVISASSHVVMFFQGEGKGGFQPLTARR